MCQIWSCSKNGLNKGELERLNISSPEQIWNCDETGYQDVPKEQEVVGETGVDAYNIVSNEQGETRPPQFLALQMLLEKYAHLS